MRIAMLLGTSLLIAGGCALNTQRNLTPDRSVSDLEERLLSLSFVDVKSVAELPSDLRTLAAPGASLIAEPGRPYNFTDVMEPGVPDLRLALGGLADSAAFVLLDAGGYVGPHQRLVIGSRENGTISIHCTYVLLVIVDSLEGLKSAIPSNIRPTRGSHCE